MAEIDDAALHRIVQQIVGPTPGLFVPKLPKSIKQKIGARFIVAPSRRELPGGPPSPDEFFNTLHLVPMPAAVGGLSAINLIVSRISYLDPIHKLLHSRFLTLDRQAQVQQFVKDNPSVPDAIHVFNRVGVLLLQRLAFAVSSLGDGEEDASDQLLGEIALLANDYVTGSAIRREEKKDKVDYVTMLVEILPTWDIANGPDLAYGLTRAYRMLQVHLLGNDPTVVELRKKLPLDFANATFDGLVIDEYVACIFGMYSWYETLDLSKLIAGEINGVIDTSAFLSKTHFPKASFEGFVKSRSKTINEFRTLVSADAITTAALLSEKLDSDAFIADTIPIRSYPLCRLDGTHLVCLDTRFLSELLIYGLYWRILGALKKGDGDLFLSLWGRLFELYMYEQLAFHYPSFASPLRTDVTYDGGQVDALLDFGEDLILFEFKGSLLKIQAKYNRDVQSFKEDFSLKFVANEKGEPKALRQLAISSAAAVGGKLKLSMAPKRIFPVFVGYETSLDGFWVNRYADDIFRDLLEPGLRGRVQPLTLMSVEAFETLIAYTSAGDIPWTELLKRRFYDDKVVDYSIAQAIYDWREAEKVDVRRNSFILKDFESIFHKALAKYKDDVGDTTPADSAGHAAEPKAT
jgi:hypothetical protein